MLIEPLSGDAGVLADFVAEVQKQGTRVVEGTLGANGAAASLNALLALVPGCLAPEGGAATPRPNGSRRAKGGRPGGSGPGAEPADRRALFEQIRRGLCQLTALQPTLVWLRDVQRADLDVVECLRYLLDDLGRPRAAATDDAVPFRGLLLLTGAPGAEPLAHRDRRQDGFAGALWTAGLAGHEALDVYRHGRLDEPELRRCLGPGPAGERLLQVCRGDPNLLERYLCALPDDLGRLLSLHWDDLSPAERDTVTALAVLDGEAEFTRLSAVSGIAATALSRAIERLLSLSALRANADHVTLGPLFDPAWLRDRVGPAAWAEWHRRAARYPAVVPRAGDGALSLAATARHWVAAGEPERALEPALAAVGLLLPQRLLKQAQGLLVEVRDAWAQGPAPPQLSELLAEVLEQLGEAESALHLREQLLTGDPARDVAQLARIAVLTNRLQDSARALARLDEALTAARDHGRADLVALLLLERAEVLFRQGAFSAAAAEASAVLFGADAANEGAALDAATILGKIALVRSEWAEAARRFESVAARAAALGRNNVVARARHNLGLVAIRRGWTDQAIRQLELALALTRSACDPFGEVKIRQNLGAAYEGKQRYALAIAHLTWAVEDYERLGCRADMAHALGGLADLYLTAGDTATARRLLQRAGDIDAAEGLAHCAAFVALKTGEAALAEGQYEEARVQLTKARERFHEEGALTDEALALLGLLHLAEATGDRDECSALATAMRRLPDSGVGVSKAAARLVEARRAAAEGDQGALVEIVEKELPILEEGPERLYEAEARRLWALWAERQGRPDAREARERARAMVSKMARGFDEPLRSRFLQRPAVQRVLGPVASEEASPLAASAGSGARALAKPAWALRLGIVGESKELIRVLHDAGRFAACDEPVLILGETGTGKESIATALHQLSRRARGPFLKVNAGGVPDGLLASELFGHEKGAFTGASQRTRGKFEAAHGGTLFLDEIGDITPQMQVALLRVLQDQTITRVGSNEPIELDVRVVFATNRDLKQAVAAGRFSEALYYRLHGLSLCLPPLRHRRKDIRLLVAHFLRRLAEREGRTVQFREEALALLEADPWPGNIRELWSVVLRAYRLTDTEWIGVEELHASGYPPDGPGRNGPPHPNPGTGTSRLPAGYSLRGELLSLEKERIQQALDQNRGNISAAARGLGLTRARLSQKIKQYGILMPSRRRPS